MGSPKKQKAHSLTGRITKDFMLKAWKSVKKNRGTAGIDKVSIEMFESNLEQNLDCLMRELKNGSYKPIPLKRKWIPKGPGKNAKLRPLGIPTVRCRVAQEVARRLIDPYFEKIFHDNSYGFRYRRNCHQAVHAVLQERSEGSRHIVDADIKGFFDDIPHSIIMKAISSEIADGNILRLIEKFLKAGVMEEGKLYPTTRGTPQGGVISPLLANAVLNHLDHKLSEQGYCFVRYADDFVILCKTRRQAESALSFATSVIEKDLGLELSKEKTTIIGPNESFDFLGFKIKPKGITMRKKSMEKFKIKIRMLTKRSHNLDKKAVEKINQVIRGTMNYFVIPWTHARPFIKFDQWIRKRLRCMKLKRISRRDNLKLKNKVFKRLGVQMCMDFYHKVKAKRQCSHPWATSFGSRPVRERCTPVNMGN